MLSVAVFGDVHKLMAMVESSSDSTPLTDKHTPHPFSACIDTSVRYGSFHLLASNGLVRRATQKAVENYPGSVWPKGSKSWRRLLGAVVSASTGRITLQASGY